MTIFSDRLKSLTGTDINEYQENQIKKLLNLICDTNIENKAKKLPTGSREIILINAYEDIDVFKSRRIIERIRELGKQGVNIKPLAWDDVKDSGYDYSELNKEFSHYEIRRLAIRF